MSSSEKVEAEKVRYLDLQQDLTNQHPVKLHLIDIPVKESRENVTMMYQDSRLLPWKSVIKNVGLGLKGNWKEKAEETLGSCWPAPI